MCKSSIDLHRGKDPHRAPRPILRVSSRTGAAPSTASSRATNFGMFRFRNGRPRKAKATVEGTPRIASAPHRGLAREDVRVALNGVEHVLTVVRQERIHGSQAYWLCNRCGRMCWYLHIRGPEISCRKCLHLTYASQRTKHGAALRARKLRRKLGAAPGLLAPLPERPRNVWAAAYYDRLARELAVQEGVIAQRLGAIVERRRKKRA